MERCLSFGSVSAGAPPLRRVGFQHLKRPELRGSVVNYPSNPCFHPRCAFKVVESLDMKQDRQCLEAHAIVIIEEGPLSVRSREEVKDIIHLNFNIRKHEFSVVRSRQEPFVAVFQDSHHRDIIFTIGMAVDGPVELGLHPWDVDRFGDNELFPYHAKICVEGIPQHIWSKEVVSKLLGDESIIIHVEEDTARKVDQRSFDCWVVCNDLSRIPQLVLLSIM
jgi:hypothetical protein